MRLRPINIVGGFGADEAVPWSVEDTVNLIPEAASTDGTRTQAKLRGAPGLRTFSSLGTNPTRGAHNAEGSLFIVAGQTLYQVATTGVKTALGTVPGYGRVSMAHNQIVGGNQLIITTGTTSSFVYSTVSGVFQQITDEGYPGAGSVDYTDTYFVQVEPFGRYFFWSGQADGTSYNTLDRAEAETSPDGIVGLAVNNFEVVVFGTETAEFFYDAGTTTGTFKSKRISIDHGCAGRHTIAKMDNTLFWLSPFGILYRLNGYRAEPVSTPQFEEAISKYNLSNAFATIYEDQGHKIYYLTFPDGKTFGFDVTTKTMHRRQSYQMNRWRLNTLTYWNRMWVGGDFQNGTLYTLDWNYYIEGSDPLIAERITRVLSYDQAEVTIPHFELLVDSGGETSVPTPFPIASIFLTSLGNKEFYSIYQGTVYKTLAVAGTSSNVAKLSTGRLYARSSSNSYYSNNDGAAWTTIGVATDDNPALLELGGNLYTGAPNVVWKSTDQGLTWSFTVVSANPMDFVTNGTAIVAVCSSGSNKILRSTDAGVTWPSINTLSLYSFRTLALSGYNRFAAAVGNSFVVAGVDDATGVAAILVSTDAGVTWAKKLLPTHVNSNDIQGIADDGTSILIVSSKASNGVIFQYSPATDAFTVILAATGFYPANLWHVGDCWYCPLYTYNGSATWLWSMDKVTWTSAAKTGGYNELLGVAYDATGAT